MTEIHLLSPLRNRCLSTSLRVVLVYEFGGNLEFHVLIKSSGGIILNLDFFFYFLLDHTLTRALVIVIQIPYRLKLIGEVLWRIENPTT